MQRRAVAVLVLTFLSTTAFGKEVFLSVTGKANGFFTDARILNPSFDKDITVNAQYLPSGNGNNTGATIVQLTIPKRSMRVFDDAVQSMFGGGPALGAIRLTSEDDFVATQRIYQDLRLAPQAGTLGQFVPGLDLATAKKKGVLLQLKSGQAVLGNFRTNWGGANPNSVVANVTLKLHDKANAVVATKTRALQPFGVQGPQNIVELFDNTTRDLTDAWISFESDQPVFLYGSVVDNGSGDPTFVPAADDSGVAPVQQQKTVTISAVDWAFNLSGETALRQGDSVKVLLSAAQGAHGFQLFSPSGQSLINVSLLGATVVERIITLSEPGNYFYFCTRSLCGAGHSTMSGDLVVGAAGNSGTGPGY